MVFSILTGGVPAVARGSLVLFSAFEDHGPMWAAQGPREERRRIDFGGAFLGPPAVHVALNMWDIADGANQRAEVTAADVGDRGFTVSFRTWGDTRVARVSVSWIAVGVAPDPGLWNL